MTPDHSNYDAVDRTTTDAAVAAHLDMDIPQTDHSIEDLQALLDQIQDDIPPLVSSVLETLIQTIETLQNRIDDLETKQEQTHDIATTASGKAETNASDIDDLEADQEKTHDIATSAVAKANQLEGDQQEDAETLPDGVEPSSSQLDFFANCCQSKVKQAFVEESNRQNTYRAIAVAKRWPEFATKRTDGSGVFLNKDDVQTALTAELGKQPHRQTVSRVWDKLLELGGSDVVEKRRTVGRNQTTKQILTMDKDTAEGLLEKRYIGLDLLEATTDKAQTGGVTPVVTGNPPCTL
jgi:archaellum component FlaC